MSKADWWQPGMHQRCFRAVLEGFARPGALVPTQGQDALLLFLATVLDESVTLADPLGLIGADIRRLLLAPEAPVAEARFVLFDGRQPPAPELALALGTLESPELGATLVLKVGELAADDSAAGGTAMLLRLQGPGVAGTRAIAVNGLHRAWLLRRVGWVEAFPMGVDLVLAAPAALVALPRTTHIAFAMHGEGG